MNFFPSQRLDLHARMAYMSFRNPNRDGGPNSPPTAFYAMEQPALKPGMEAALGGGRIYTSPVQYIKVLRDFRRCVCATCAATPQINRRHQ